MTLACHDVRAAAPELALGVLDGAERAALLAHLATCAACRADVRDLGDVVEALAVMAPSAQPPAGFVERVLAAGGAEGMAGPGPQARAAGRAAGPGVANGQGAGAAGATGADEVRPIAPARPDLASPGAPGKDGPPERSSLAPPGQGVPAPAPPRIAARARARWFRPALLGAAAAVVALVAGLALGLRHDDSQLNVALDARSLRAASMVGAGDYAVGQAFLSQGSTPWVLVHVDYGLAAGAYRLQGVSDDGRVVDVGRMRQDGSQWAWAGSVPTARSFVELRVVTEDGTVACRAWFR